MRLALSRGKVLGKNSSCLLSVKSHGINEPCFFCTFITRRRSLVQIQPPQPRNSFISAVSLCPATIRIDEFLNACRCLGPAQLAP
jgi:hypothetical protein